ncbi:unnamed protein product, partial [Owenia fusiformis]
EYVCTFTLENIVCGATFRQRVKLEEHERVFHRIPHKVWHCLQCPDRSFGSLAKLNKHTRNCHSVRFFCPESGCNFNRPAHCKNNIERHIATHMRPSQALPSHTITSRDLPPTPTTPTANIPSLFDVVLMPPSTSEPKVTWVNELDTLARDPSTSSTFMDESLLGIIPEDLFKGMEWDNIARLSPLRSDVSSDGTEYYQHSQILPLSPSQSSPEKTTTPPTSPLNEGSGSQEQGTPGANSQILSPHTPMKPFTIPKKSKTTGTSKQKNKPPVKSKHRGTSKSKAKSKESSKKKSKDSLKRKLSKKPLRAKVKAMKKNWDTLLNVDALDEELCQSSSSTSSKSPKTPPKTPSWKVLTPKEDTETVLNPATPVSPIKIVVCSKSETPASKAPATNSNVVQEESQTEPLNLVLDLSIRRTATPTTSTQKQKTLDCWLKQ